MVARRWLGNNCPRPPTRMRDTRFEMRDPSPAHPDARCKMQDARSPARPDPQPDRRLSLVAGRWIHRPPGTQGPVPGTRSNVPRRTPTRHQSACLAPGRTHRLGQSTPARGCLARTRAIGVAKVASTRPLPEAFPAVATSDDVCDQACNRDGTDKPQKRRKWHARRRGCQRRSVRVDSLTPDAPSPGRAPRGCPLSQCCDRKSHPGVTTVGPNIVKDGTPQEARGRHARRRRCRRPAVCIACLTPDAPCPGRAGELIAHSA
jgi:hypothetical protein